MCSCSRACSSSSSTSTRGRAFRDQRRVRATLRSVSTAATTIPISTATMRSNATVATAVTHQHERVGTGRAQHRPHGVTSTIRTAVTMRHPAALRAGCGHEPAADDDHERAARRRGRWPPRGYAAPAADVDGGAGDRAGRGHAAEQRRDDVREALPEQLAIGVVAGTSAMPSATLAESRLSMAARSGDGERRSTGRCPAGRAASAAACRRRKCGRAARRCVVTFQPAPPATTVATTTARTRPGKSGDPRTRHHHRGHQRTSQRSVGPVRGPGLADGTQRRPPRCSRRRAWRRRAPAGTCCRKMMTAMPTANPSITGQGMKATNRPTRTGRPSAP